jgi:transposase
VFRRELSDSHWELIGSHLPIGQYGPYPENLRDQLEGIIWQFRTGSPWRDVPEVFGSWSTVYDRFAQWRDAGVFAAVLEALIAEAARRGQADLSLVSVDSTTARAHHDAAGMVVDEEALAALEKVAEAEKGAHERRESGVSGRLQPKPEEVPLTEEAEPDPKPEKRRRQRRRRRARLKAAALGRSRGGLTSKVHLSAERRCRPLSFAVTPGQAADSPQFSAVLAGVRVRGPVGCPHTRPGAVADDKAYSSRANRAHLRRRKIKAVIPEKADQAANRKKGARGGRPVSHDAELYKERNTVEQCINKIKDWRGLATRFDKRPDSYIAGLQLRGAAIWLRSLQPDT